MIIIKSFMIMRTFIVRLITFIEESLNIEYASIIINFITFIQLTLILKIINSNYFH